MTHVRVRVRFVVLVGTVVALLTLFGSTAVGAADFGYAGRLGGDLSRGISPPSGSGGAGTIAQTGFSSRVNGGPGNVGGGSGGSGAVTSTGPSSFAGPFSSGVSGVSGSGGAGSITTFRR